MREKLRTVRFRPYRYGKGPRFTLTTWDTGKVCEHKSVLSYQFNQVENGTSRVVFAGTDFCPSPSYSIDGDDTVAALMGFPNLAAL